MTPLRGALVCFLLVGPLSFLSGCADSIRSIPAPPPAPAFEELMLEAARISGLSFLDDVRVNPEPFDKIQVLSGSLAFSQTAQLYARLGLLTERSDAPKVGSDVTGVRKAFRYEPRRKEIVVSDELKPVESFVGRPLSWDGTLQLIQALTRALHEQHFQTEKELSGRNSQDGRLAFRALAEGAATLAGLTYFLGDFQSHREKFLAEMRDLRSRYERQAVQFSGLARLLHQKEIFFDIDGSLFVLWAQVARGREGVHALFAAPPGSTEQILHPEKYYVKRDEPLRVDPWGLMRLLGGRTVSSETLGEYLIQRLLAGFLPEEEAINASAGWAGDRLLVFPEENGLGIAWITVWDEAAEAREFYEGYRRALEKSRGTGASSRQPGSGAVATFPSNGPRLEWKERVVFFLDGVSSLRAKMMADSLWQGLEIGTDLEAVSIDLGSRGAGAPHRIK